MIRNKYLENEFLRKIYTGEENIKNITVDDFWDVSPIDVISNYTSCRINFEDKDDCCEFIFSTQSMESFYSTELFSVMQRHLKPGTFSERISEDYDSIEYIYRFEKDALRANLKKLEGAFKEAFEENYINQNPFQIKETLRCDRDFLHKIIAKRISKGSGKPVFSLNTKDENLIYAGGNKMIVKNYLLRPEIEKAINDFAAENGYGITIGEDLRYDKLATIESNKAITADDVIKLIQKITYYWEEPWNVSDLPHVDRVIEVKSLPYEACTTLNSLYSYEARIVAKMLGTLPKSRVRNVLGKFYVDKTQEYIREAKKRIEIGFEYKGETYRHKIDILRSRSGTEFRIDTTDEIIASKALVALSQALLPEIKEYNKRRKVKYWE